MEVRADEGRVDEEDLQIAGLSSKFIADKNGDENRYDSDNDDSMMSQPSSTSQSFDDDERED